MFSLTFILTKNEVGVLPIEVLPIERFLAREITSKKKRGNKGDFLTIEIISKKVRE